MLATLSSKGQVTLPKEIRDHLALDAGARLDFQLQPDNTITVRLVKPDALRLRGLLKSNLPRALSPAQEAAAVGEHLRARHHPGGKKPKPLQP